MPKYTSVQLSHGWTVHRDGGRMLLLLEPLTEEEAKAICTLLNAEFSALATPPTDALVEALKQARQNYYDKHDCERDTYEQGYIDGMERAISIVKDGQTLAPQGGKKEDVGRWVDWPQLPVVNGCVTVPLDVMNLCIRLLDEYAHPDTYRGERTGGILKGCPRGPAPTPDELATRSQINRNWIAEKLQEYAREAAPSPPASKAEGET